MGLLSGGLFAGELSSEKKAELERAALAGSPSAAREVALFHGTKNDELFEYWSWIGAENDDPICQYNYASILQGKEDAYSHARAVYWMKKAAAKKVPFAEDALRKMGQLGS
jgi:hypothetical protein